MNKRFFTIKLLIFIAWNIVSKTTLALRAVLGLVGESFQPMRAEHWVS